MLIPVTIKQLSISEFKAHCTEEIRALEKADCMIELTRHGKKVAVVQSAAAAKTAPNLADWVGSGKGSVTYGPNYDPAAPAWDPENWDS